MHKISALFRSRRFWALMAGTAVTASGDSFGISQQESNVIAALLGTWILGDSYHKTE